MTKGKTKDKHAASKTSEVGNARSAESAGLARPWTDEEMAAAKPLPLPMVDPPAKVGVSGVVHAGKGETKPAGRPEDDGAAG